MRDGATSEVDWVERYEALRAHALGQAQVGFVPLDLALLQCRGLAAWITANVSSRQPLNSHENGSCREKRGAEATRETPRTELVRVLAGMALLGRRRGAA